MADVATLAVELRSDQVEKGKAALNKLIGAAERAEAATTGVEGVPRPPARAMRLSPPRRIAQRSLQDQCLKPLGHSSAPSAGAGLRDARLAIRLNSTRRCLYRAPDRSVNIAGRLESTPEALVEQNSFHRHRKIRRLLEDSCHILARFQP